MSPEQKKWIDASSYEGLLHKWRFAAVGDAMFQGDTGDYYSKVMAEKRSSERDGGVSASKSVGWDKS